jgi:hypothetical protein
VVVEALVLQQEAQVLEVLVVVVLVAGLLEQTAQLIQAAVVEARHLAAQLALVVLVL